MENDWIQGVVIKVINGNTFLLKSNLVNDEHSNRIYQQIEQIRISGISAGDPTKYEGILAKNRLRARIENRKVQCTVLSRESDNALLCTVIII